MTVFHKDLFDGTSIEQRGDDELRIVVAHAPFSKLTMTLDRDEVDRLLAVQENAIDPVMDIAEHFCFVHHAQQVAAERGARAFVRCAGNIAHAFGL
jgi:hypothetical protein